MTRNALECAMQRSLVKVINARKVPGVVYWHSPNEGKRSVVMCSILKLMGMRPGVSDLMFSIPPNGRVAALELKAPKMKPTELQAMFMNDIVSSGGFAFWTDNYDEAIKTLVGWGVIK